MFPISTRLIYYYVTANYFFFVFYVRLEKGFEHKFEITQKTRIWCKSCEKNYTLRKSLRMSMLVMLKQNLRSWNSSPGLVSTCWSSQPSVSSSKASLKCFYCLPWTSIMWHFKDSFKVKFFSQDLHSTSVLCVFSNSK